MRSLAEGSTDISMRVLEELAAVAIELDEHEGTPNVRIVGVRVDRRLEKEASRPMADKSPRQHQSKKSGKTVQGEA